MCPRCKSDQIRLSKTPNFVLDLIMRVAGMRAFRCDDCQKRFYANSGLAQKVMAERAWLREEEEKAGEAQS